MSTADEADDVRDDAINQAFEYLVDDDLEAFAIAVEVDGELRAMSYTPVDEDPTQLDEVPPCGIPRLELLGKLLGDFSMFFGRSPAETADVATHVATDHLAVDAEAIDQFRQQALEVPE